MQPHIKSVATKSDLPDLVDALGRVRDTIAASLPNASDISISFANQRMLVFADFRKAEHAQAAMELVRCGAIPALAGCSVNIGTPPPGRIMNRVVISPTAMGSAH